MSLSARDKVLLYVGKAESKTLAAIKSGPGIEAAQQTTILDLSHQACADRLLLGVTMLDSGDRFLRSRPPMFRMAVSRYYYSMYHSMRAVCYFAHEGDDHEEHSVLPTKTPTDFTNRAFWQNELKDARLRRNEADYDPYPIEDRDFASAARHLRVQARLLSSEARSYLKARGCAYV